MFGSLVILALLLTSSSPWVPRTRAANAPQVEVARNAFRQVRQSRASGHPAELKLSSRDLQSIASLITQGFPPNRLALKIADGKLEATASRPIWFRWLNIRANASGHREGCPELQLTVGSVSFPRWLSRSAIALLRRTLVARGADVPPLDSIVQSSTITHSGVQARVLLPRTGLINQAAGYGAVVIDPSLVAKIYCRLAAEQQAAPKSRLAEQLNRALTAAEATPEANGAALVAVAMLVVDPAVGELTGDARAKAANCLVSPVRTTLQGRSDWPKHWSLSAALTVTAGRPLAVAMGEWKELSDSLSGQRYFGAGDRSGFSLADLGADRAGYLTARTLLDPATFGSARARLLIARDQELMPLAFTRLGDGMSNAEFVRHYGATDDPRFTALLDKIDGELEKAGIR